MTELFLSLVNRSISAGWLILAVIVLRLLLKKAPKWLNVALWGLAGIRLTLPVSIESIFSLIPSSETIRPEIMHTSVPTVNIGIPALNHAVNPIISTTLAPAPGDSANPLQIWIPVCSILWIGGMVCLLSYAVISYWRLHRRVAEAIPLKENIYQCEQVDSPFVLGILRPRIYLPFYSCGQTGSASQADFAGAADYAGAVYRLPLSAMIAHEQAHIRRRDHWWKPLGFLLLTLYWFNPLVWIAYVLLCRDIEFACDEKVIKELDNDQRADYSQALLSCSVNRKRISACPLAFGETGVKERVKSVLNYRRPAFWIIAAAVIVCGAAALCFLTDPERQRESMAWARGLTADMVANADLVVFPQAPERQFMRLSGEEISAMVDLINQSRGRYLEEHENLNGGSIFFYLTLQDGSTHSVGNIGNTYLFIDGDYYEAKYQWLSTWDNDFREGNAPLPEDYSFGQMASGQSTSGQMTPGGSGSAASSEDDGFAPGEAEKSVFQDAAIWEDADLNHDGETEWILVHEQNGGDFYELQVVKQDGTVLWSMDMGIAHTGWGAILLYSSGGKDYLVEYRPTIYQGMGSYTCTQFSLEGDVETEENQWTADFQMPVQEMTSELRAFAEIGNMIMEDSVVLLSTGEGELVIGPVDAKEVNWLYPVSFGEEDGMETDMQDGTQTGMPDNTEDNMPDGTQTGSVASGQELSTDIPSWEFLSADAQPMEFLFASGAGGWGTTLTLYPDGRFEGVYEDSEAVAAPEYPRGTRYICKFSGRFGGITGISDYAYSMQLEELAYETETDKVWIEDGIRNIGADALGIAEGKEFILYTPDAPPEELDEEFLYWWPDYYLWNRSAGAMKKLYSYGIQNVNTKQGFFTSWL